MVRQFVNVEPGKRGGLRGRKVHNCTHPECKKVYTRHEHLLRHQRTRHQSPSKPFCEPCGQGFSRGDSLKKHTETLRHQRNVVQQSLLPPQLSMDMRSEQAETDPVSTFGHNISSSYFGISQPNPWPTQLAGSDPMMSRSPERDVHNSLGFIGQYVSPINSTNLPDQTFGTSTWARHSPPATLRSRYAPVNEDSLFLHCSPPQADTPFSSPTRESLHMSMPPSCPPSGRFTSVPGHHNRRYNHGQSYRQPYDSEEQRFSEEQDQPFAPSDSRNM